MTIHKLFKKVEFDRETYIALMAILNRYRCTIQVEQNIFQQASDETEIDEIKSVAGCRSKDLDRVDSVIQYIAEHAR